MERFAVHEDQYGADIATQSEWEGAPGTGVIHISKAEWAERVLGAIESQFDLDAIDFFEEVDKGQLDSHPAVSGVLELLELRTDARQDLLDYLEAQTAGNASI